ncbi:hypothetical protein [Winogradskyella sp. SM1960]|uniref:hypothetical protein n=1 Tax=Winogradskyella sp. SM1960 TaxID=2865955 RepID=UPI001CD42768|nr:hypothetical protein [Winogradskyella sp. SM1960]
MPSNSMNVINFNRNQLSKRDRLKHVLGGYNPNRKTEYNLPKATTKQLKTIAKRLKEERKYRMLKVILVTIILSLILVAVLLYSLDGIVGLVSL